MQIESGRGSYERLQEKYDELAEKNEVVQSQILKMTNEHE